MNRKRIQNPNLFKGLTIGYFARIKRRSTPGSTGTAGGEQSSQKLKKVDVFAQPGEVFFKDDLSINIKSDIERLASNGSSFSTLQANVNSLSTEGYSYFQNLWESSFNAGRETGIIFFTDGTYGEGKASGEHAVGFGDLLSQANALGKTAMLCFHTHPFAEGIPSPPDLKFCRILGDIPGVVIGGGLQNRRYVTVYTQYGVTGVYDAFSGTLTGQSIGYNYPIIEKDGDYFSEFQSYTLIKTDGTEDIIYDNGDPDKPGGQPNVTVTPTAGGIREREEEIVLMDEHRNRYPLSRVSICVPNNSFSTGEIKLPTPFEMDEDEKITKVGAKVFIAFPVDRDNPVVVDAMVPLNKQSIMNGKLQFETDELERTVKVQKGDDWGIEEERARSGYVVTITDTNYVMTVAGEGKSIKHAAYNYVSEAQNRNTMLGKEIEIGGDSRRISDEETLEDVKAEFINLIAKRVIVGHSDLRIGEIEVDEAGQVDDPKLQPMVMGIALVELVTRTIDILINALYLGSGVAVKLSAVDQAKLIQEVKAFLPNILSEVGYVLRKADQLE